LVFEREKKRMREQSSRACLLSLLVILIAQAQRRRKGALRKKKKDDRAGILIDLIAFASTARSMPGPGGEGKRGGGERIPSKKGEGRKESVFPHGEEVVISVAGTMLDKEKREGLEDEKENKEKGIKLVLRILTLPSGLVTEGRKKKKKTFQWEEGGKKKGGSQMSASSRPFECRPP